MENEVLPLLRSRLGISAQSRDAGRPDHILFVLDWATWKYSHPEDGATPRSIQFRLKNLVIQKAGRADETDDLG